MSQDKNNHECFYLDSGLSQEARENYLWHIQYSVGGE
jgi:hypothetical protein